MGWVPEHPFSKYAKLSVKVNPPLPPDTPKYECSKFYFHRKFCFLLIIVITVIIVGIILIVNVVVIRFCLNISTKFALTHICARHL